ncbi:MAG: hypothetical protein IJQ73_07415, partial [Kiritimatiellae bacterium]|nr:hypothetical protein [Kiritimatiellia bacterium]
TTLPVAEFTVTPPARTNANEVAFEMAFDGDPLNAERWTYVVSNLTDTSAAPITGATTEAGFVLATPVASDSEISYQITAIAYDRAGNASASATYAWVYDTLAPTALFDVAPAATDDTWQTNTTWNVSITGDTQVVRYWYKLDDAAPVTNVYPAVSELAFADLADGEHTVRIAGGDVAGNWQAEPTVYTRIVDTLAPTAIFDDTTLPAAFDNTGDLDASVTQESAEPEDEVIDFKWKLEYAANPANLVLATAGAPAWMVLSDWSEAMAAREATITTNNLADGAYRLSAIGRDTAGNWQLEDDAAVYVWVVDRTLPAADFSPKPEFITTNAIDFTCVSNSLLDSVTWKYSVTNSEGTVIASADAFAAANGTISLTGLADDFYSVRVWGADMAGNEQTEATEHVFEVDATPPEVILVGVPEPYTNLVVASVMATNAPVELRRDELVKWVYALNPDDQANIAWSRELDSGVFAEIAAAENQENVLYVKGVDCHGNWSEPVSTNWIVDTTLPVAEFTVTPPARTNANEVAFEMAFDGDPLNAERWTYVVSNLTDTSAAPITGATTEAGFVLATPVASDSEISYQITAVAYDRAGNASAPATYAWVYDTLAPEAAFTVAPPATDDTWQTNATWTATVTGDDQVVRYKWTLDDGAETLVAINGDDATTRDFEVGPLADGEHTVKVWGGDLAGNWQADPTVYTRTVDTVAPEAVLSGVPALYTQETAAEITVTNAAGLGAEDSVVRYRYRLEYTNDVYQIGAEELAEVLVDWTDATAISEAIGATGLADGLYQLKVVGIDAAGNEQEVPGMVTNWVVDTVAPVAAFASPEFNEHDIHYTNGLAIAFSFASTGMVDAVEWKWEIEGVSVSDWSETASFSVTLPADGTYTNRVWGRDAAGNEQDEPTVRYWTIDSTPPTEAEIHVTPWIDNVRTNVTDWSFAVSVNMADSEDPDPQAAYTWSWTIDGVEQSGPYGTTNGVAAALAVSSPEGAAVVHQVKLFARDAAGNWCDDANAVTFSFTVDTVVPPKPVFAEPLPAELTNSWTTGFTLDTAGTDAAAWRYVVTDENGNVIASNTTTVATIPMEVPADGRYTITIWAQDGAGNWNEDEPLVFEWTADVTAPQALFADPLPPELCNSNTAAFVISATDALGAADGYSWSWNVTNSVGETVVTGVVTNPTLEFVVMLPDGAPDGVYTIQLLGTDEAGNAQTSPVEGGVFVWTYDTTPPVNPASFFVPDMPLSPTNATTAWAVMNNDADIAEWKLTLEFNDGGTWVEKATDVLCQPADGATTRLDGIYAFSGAGDEGDWRLSVIGRDAAGNWQTAGAATHEWTYDCTPPVAVFTDGPENLTQDRIASFTASSAAGEECVAWKYRVIDAGSTQVLYPWTEVTRATFQVQVPSEGTYQIVLLGKDKAGNWQDEANVAEEGQWVWTVDEPSAIVESAQRDTSLDTVSSNLSVTVTIKLLDTRERDLIFREEIAGGVEATISGVAGADYERVDAVTDATELVLHANKGANQVVISYVVQGTVGSEDIAGIVRWYEKSNKTERARTLTVRAGVHTVTSGNGFQPGGTSGSGNGTVDGTAVAPTLTGISFNQAVAPDGSRAAEGRTVSLGWADVAPGSQVIFEYKTDLSASSWKVLGRVESAEPAGSATFAVPAEAEKSAFFRFRVEAPGE